MALLASADMVAAPFLYDENPPLHEKFHDEGINISLG
jgi:hypothetical protein